MNATSISQGTRITPLSDFPITWKNPEDKQCHWTHDREHMPAPITPMFNSAACAMVVENRNRATATYDEAIAQRSAVSPRVSVQRSSWTGFNSRSAK